MWDRLVFIFIIFIMLEKHCYTWDISLMHKSLAELEERQWKYNVVLFVEKESEKIVFFQLFSPYVGLAEEFLRRKKDGSLNYDWVKNVFLAKVQDQMD